MKQEFEVYLKSIDLSSKTIKANIDLVIQYATKLCKEEIADIFVEDYYKDDGSREYGSLWLISTGYLCEVRNFRSTAEYDVDVAPIKNSITYLRSYFKNYDLKNISNESRVSVQFINAASTDFQLGASRENCKKLMEVIENHIKPNM